MIDAIQANRHTGRESLGAGSAGRAEGGRDARWSVSAPAPPDAAGGDDDA
jgi:hypothetical protein